MKTLFSQKIFTSRHQISQFFFSSEVKRLFDKNRQTRGVKIEKVVGQKL